MINKVSAAQKQQTMTQLLASKQGRSRIAASVQEPLRSLRDYVSIGRKLFMVDQLPDGALPIYDRDVDTPSYIVAEQGDSIQKVVTSDRVMVPLFEIASNPTVPFTQVKERRFDIVKRIKQKAQDELFRTEDNYLFNLCSVAATNSVNTPISVTESQLGMDDLADAFKLIERHGLRVDKIVMNPSRFKLFRTMGRDFFDSEVQNSVLKTGFMGVIWGAEVFMSMEVPENQIICATEADYFGVLPVRIDLTVLPADEPNKRQYGWSIFECIGAGQTNGKGISSITIG